MCRVWSLIFFGMAAAKVGCKSSCTRSKYQGDQGKLPAKKPRTEQLTSQSGYYRSLKNYATSNGVPRIISFGKTLPRTFSNEVSFNGVLNNTRITINTKWVETCKSCDSRVCLICHCNVLLQSCRRDSMTSKYANYLHTIFVVSSTSFILDSCKPVVSRFMVHCVPIRSPAVPWAAPLASGSLASHHTSLREDSSTNAKTALEKHVFTMIFYIFSKSMRVLQQTHASCSKKALRAIHNSAPPPPPQQ